LGNRKKGISSENETPATVGIRADQVFLQAKLLAKGKPRRLGREKTVRAVLEKTAPIAGSLDGTAEPVRGLQERHLDRKASLSGLLQKPKTQGEPRDPPTHDDDSLF
jgi:hypothetical protein